MKIALAHDSFTQLGGAERVLEALHELYPDAPVFTLVFDPQFKEQYKTWDIRTSRIQPLFLSLGKLQYCLPLIPYGVDSLDFEGYDLIISSSSGFIKNLRKPKNAIHVNYCHTPTRFLWSEPKSYVKQEVKWFLRPIASVTLSRMKKWDHEGAQRVTKFIANSKEVQKRIKEYYNRDSNVIYPFVDIEFWKPTATRSHSEGVQPTEESQTADKDILHASQALRVQDDAEKKDYFLLAGRLQAHKNNELIVEIFNELGLPLHIVGSGRQEEYLKSIAKPNISFFGKVSDSELRDQYSGALAYIYPQTEDFGLMPLEAAACGTPTLAYAQGGALETIVPGITGEFFTSYDKEKIKQIILDWKVDQYKTEALRQQAENFNKEKFKEKMINFINLNR